MIPAPIPENEPTRLAALQRYKILDTAPEKSFDDLTFLASYICGTPIALVSLIDEKRQWFKSRIGLDATETPREISFCGHAIVQEGTFIVRDTISDNRFSDNPLVKGDPRIRFYAGTPLKTSDGEAIGTLCVIDRSPRDLFTPQRLALEALARQVATLIDHRQVASELAESLETIRLLSGIVPICAWCKKIREDDGEWIGLEPYIQNRSEAKFTHGICPSCKEKALTGMTSS